MTIEERTHATKVFYQYIEDYVYSKGGMDKLKLLSPVELDVIWNEEIDGLLNDLRQLGNKFRQ